MFNTEFEYTNIDRIIAVINLKYSSLDINKDFIIEMTGEALNNIGIRSFGEERVFFGEVKNHRLTYPSGTKNIIQIARNFNHPEYHYKQPCQNGRAYSTLVEDTGTLEKALEECPVEIQEIKDLLCPAAILETMVEQKPEQKDSCINKYMNSNTCCHPIVDCQGKIIGDHEVAYYRPYFDLLYDYHLWTNSSYYKQNYTPVRLATHSMFNSFVCKEKDYDNIYRSSKDEYSIKHPYLIFSFKEGSIAMSYLAPKTDEKGYPMIPDVQPYLDAITSYIVLQHTMDKFIAGKVKESVINRLDRDYQWNLSVAHTYKRKHKSIDELKNFTDSNNYMLPRNNQYNNFFGNFAHAENRRWLNPQRNNYVTPFISTWRPTGR